MKLGRKQNKCGKKPEFLAKFQFLTKILLMSTAMKKKVSVEETIEI